MERVGDGEGVSSFFCEVLTDGGGRDAEAFCGFSLCEAMVRDKGDGQFSADSGESVPQ